MDINELFQKDKRESAVDIVVNNIKQLLIERKLNPGDRLPSELEISEGMGVSRGSVREAMKILSAFGLVDIRVGNGTYICDTPGNKLMDSLLFSFFIANPDTENLYELRQTLEIDVLELILAHYDENQEERLQLQQNLNELEHLMLKQATPQELQQNDLTFHRILGSCTKNPLIDRIYSIVIDFMEPSITLTHKKQRGEYVYKTHQDIVNIINDRNADRIKEVVTASVDTWSTLQN